MIVAEVSKSWGPGATDSNKPTVHAQFQKVIKFNCERGYRLHSWRFTQTLAEHGILVETIIAVFEEEHRGE